jgi:hypothetical protein
MIHHMVHFICQLGNKGKYLPGMSAVGAPSTDKPLKLKLGASEV